ncbi:MAG TPA: hypothetical protein VNA24_36570 [Hyalangium sp.]|nr:hypothetical protein [Hyalangium sp.]
MRRFLEIGLLCAALLASAPGLAQDAGTEGLTTDEAAPEEEVAPEEEAAAEEEPTTLEEVAAAELEEPVRFGYADSTGNLENLDDRDELRVSVRTGALRAKRGYTPLEVTLYNSENVPRAVRLSFQGYGSGSPQTERALELAPRQRLTTYLLVPASVHSGVFSVSGPGLPPRTTGVYLDDGSALSMVVLGASKAFEASTAIPRAEDSKPPEVNTRFLPVQDAPRELAAYVGYPLVMVTEDVVSVPSDVWAALENYAAAGGSLILSRPPRDVHQRLPLLSPEATRDTWNAYGFGNVYLCQSGPKDCAKAMVSVDQDGTPPLDPVGPPPRWENNRFALNRGETPLLPNALVPVGRFLILIFLFSLVVGPGGLILARRRGPVALLIGVPAVALLTCSIIVADSVLVDGFVTHSSRYSYTWLDRPRDRAVTSVVGGYYANLATSEVQFPANSVLLAPDELDEWLVDVRWNGGGMVADGFLPARTYMEWGELAVVPTRARLVARREGSGVKVQNALGAPLKEGYLRLGKKYYSLPELADGAEGLAVELERVKPQAGIADRVSLPLGMKRRAKTTGPDFLRPLEEGHFLARMGGMGFGPLAAMKVELHEGTHYVRGQVDSP